MINSKLDVIGTNADFEGINIGKTDLELLALYWALVRYDEDIRSGAGRIVTSAES